MPAVYRAFGWVRKSSRGQVLKKKTPSRQKRLRSIFRRPLIKPFYAVPLGHALGGSFVFFQVPFRLREILLALSICLTHLRLILPTMSNSTAFFGQEGEGWAVDRKAQTARFKQRKSHDLLPMILGNPPGPAAPLPGPKGGESFLIEAVDYAGTFFWERPVFLLILGTVSPSIESRTTPA